ncbi:MAG: DUF5127 domain-containing protein, partial [Clostridia bacterium]|nr:DUF5127 domain-containing protein [Clostridia bacterium]
MRLRPPSVPLITVDPFFSVWSPADHLTDTDTTHWTGFPNIIIGVAEIDGKPYRMIGRKRDAEISSMKRVSRDVDAFTTTYVMEQNGVRLTLLFSSPILPDDLYYLTRPVSYLEIRKESTDGKDHTVKVSLKVSEQICLDVAGDDEVVTEVLSHGNIKSVRMGSKSQKVLNREGDCARIDWGYFYLSSNAPDAVCGVEKITTVTANMYESKDEEREMTFVTLGATLADSTLITFAYDDVASIQYFGKNLRSY